MGSGNNNVGVCFMYDSVNGIFRPVSVVLPDNMRLTTRFSIEKVIFNDPATIIYWNDGTKTVVKCQPGDTFEKEKGFMLAVMKKVCGNNGAYNELIKRWCYDE